MGVDPSGQETISQCESYGANFSRKVLLEALKPLAAKLGNVNS
jgi:hypothetical protein